MLRMSGAETGSIGHENGLVNARAGFHSWKNRRLSVLSAKFGTEPKVGTVSTRFVGWSRPGRPTLSFCVPLSQAPQLGDKLYK